MSMFQIVLLVVIGICFVTYTLVTVLSRDPRIEKWLLKRKFAKRGLIVGMSITISGPGLTSDRENISTIGKLSLKLSDFGICPHMLDSRATATLHSKRAKWYGDIPNTPAGPADLIVVGNIYTSELERTRDCHLTLYAPNGAQIVLTDFATKRNPTIYFVGSWMNSDELSDKFLVCILRALDVALKNPPPQPVLTHNAWQRPTNFRAA